MERSPRSVCRFTRRLLSEAGQLLAAAGGAEDAAVVPRGQQRALAADRDVIVGLIEGQRLVRLFPGLCLNAAQAIFVFLADDTGERKAVSREGDCHRFTERLDLLLLRPILEVID